MYGQTNLILRKNYIQYLIPMFLVALGNSLQQFVDTIIVSNLLGSYAMAVENYAGPLTKYASFVVCLVGVGGSVVFPGISEAWNGKRRSRCSASVCLPAWLWDLFNIGGRMP